MKVIYIDSSPFIEFETVVTIGFFDGVHQGHRYLINQLKNHTQEKGLKTAVITFPVHPRKVLQNEYQPHLLNTFEERIEQLSTLGIDYCYVIDFTPKFAETTAKNFMQTILLEQLRVKELLIGYDHRFGKGRLNEYKHYQEYGKICGIKVHQAEELQCNEKHVSSTAIRHLLSEGKVEEAADYLSYNYSLQGKVIEGDKLGRTIGFPTANIELNDKNKIVPKNGVYAVWTEIEGKQYSGMAYIGKRPTILSEGEKRIEVHIFNFSQDIYGKEIRIEFMKFIRQDIRFSEQEKLQIQLGKDKIESINYFQHKIKS